MNEWRIHYGTTQNHLVKLIPYTCSVLAQFNCGEFNEVSKQQFDFGITFSTNEVFQARFVRV